MDIIRPQFLKWNNDNSEEHFDISLNPSSWETGSETFFHVYHNAVFDFTSYSNVGKDYLLTHKGVEILKEEKSVDITPPVGDPDMDAFPENHQIEIQWLITEPTGHVILNVDNSEVSIRWVDGKIRDLHGNLANLRKCPNKDHYQVEEILSQKQHEKLIEIKRLARVRDMVQGETRQMLNNKISGLFYEEL